MTEPLNLLLLALPDPTRMIFRAGVPNGTFGRVPTASPKLSKAVVRGAIHPELSCALVQGFRLS